MTAWAFSHIQQGKTVLFSFLRKIYSNVDDMFINSSIFTSLPKLDVFHGALSGKDWPRLEWWELARGGCLWGYLGLFGAIHLSARKDRNLAPSYEPCTVFFRLVVASSRLVYI